jgi:hypothetical protein
MVEDEELKERSEHNPSMNRQITPVGSQLLLAMPF